MGKETNLAVNWVLKVKDQRFSKAGDSVILDCVSLGRKKEDGTYESGMFISVVAGKDTDWNPSTKTDKYIEATGSFSHREWTSEKTGKSGLGFTIFASEIKDHEFEARTPKTAESW